ncbi:MAG: glycosyltransferase family 4 protein [Thiocapsa sp.]|uniref:glycosyltransferase family 4 protein n=1 Tax=Thiocapsa sp. TaxID=2024551 RepID=UPI001BD00254|nr:glycosyltransferase family 4 protein [Thiocapsa sp.]QVL50095.1 MAG: glycosyltransferase family 4 protein [Thiocapsa sp.]
MLEDVSASIAYQSPPDRSPPNEVSATVDRCRAMPDSSIQPCKVLLLVSGLMYGGGQRVVIDLANAARRAGLDARVILLGYQTREFDRFAPAVVDYDGQYNRLSSLLGTAWRLRRELRRQGSAILHTHGWDADIIGWLASFGLPIIRIVHLHVTPDWIGSARVKHRVRRALTRGALGSAGTVIAVSDAVRAHWAAHFNIRDQRFVTIHNGVDIASFAPPVSTAVARQVHIIGVAARLAPMKGIEYLIDALALMHRQGVSLTCRIAGKGESRAALEERCLARGVSDRVHWLGHLEDMKAFYAGIDVFVLPSVSTEGLPLGILEAMACGVPVLATRVAGAPEAVRDGIDGQLVPPRDAEALANGLTQLLADSELRATMGRAGRERAECSFSTERFAGEVFAQYRSIWGHGCSGTASSKTGLP